MTSVGSASLSRFLAILVKEFIQMRRDRMTFAMMLAIPIVQLIVFGYAINTDPKGLPTLIEMGDSGPFSRSFLSAMRNSAYFDFRGVVKNGQEADEALTNGSALFVVTIPPDFEKNVVRHSNPSILVAADATDPSATSGAVSALDKLVTSALDQNSVGALRSLKSPEKAFDVVVHRRYNPAGVTSFNIVPGLLAIILSLTMVMITAIAIVREAERGTIETLLSTPARPVEVMAGKILPYVLVGYIQTVVFIILARTLFDVPFLGGWLPFVGAVNLFIIVNLSLGFLFSTVARNQMQAMQMSFFYMLPSILLSGFMFPFAGMPKWAQIIGTAIPTTHFMRIVRKIMLKGAGITEILPDVAALVIIMMIITILAMLRYRQTLD